MDKLIHKPVMREACIKALVTNIHGVYLDATFGRGGHSRALLSSLSSQARLFVVDRDPEAIEEAQALSNLDSRVQVLHSDFASLSDSCLSIEGLTGVIMDLGVSSPQLDEAKRGFSFLRSAPLDMRMNPSHGQTAADWIATTDEITMAEVFRAYGEDKHAKVIAKSIVQQRKQQAITTTDALVALILKTIPDHQRKHHPATLVFQAIRMVVNDEENQLLKAVSGLLEQLTAGGRLVVLSYHSLEHAWVSQAVKSCQASTGRRFKKLGGAKRPSNEECQSNARARSAMLRVWERVV